MDTDKTDKETRCGVCKTPFFERNNYYYGKQFTVRDLLQEQKYFNEKRWLVNRMVLGWGVVCGLEVRWDKDAGRIEVGNGMALDCCGREIIVCEDQRVEFKDIEKACRHAGQKPDVAGRYVLCLEYDKCKTEQVDLPPLGCDKQGRTEYNRIREGFKLSIRPWDEDCARQPYDHINCLNRFKKDIIKKDEGQEPEHIDVHPPCRTTTLHEHICQELSEGCPDCKCCDCVVLATIEVRPRRPPGGVGEHQLQEQEQRQDEQAQADEGQQAEQREYEQQGEQQAYRRPGPRPSDIHVDPCKDRRFVYNNSLLYDLIYCHHGDLPHIVNFSWRKYTYPRRVVSWDDFVKMIKDGLKVYFDQEMARASLNPHTFFLTFFDRQDETGTYIVKRIPAEAIHKGKEGDCYTATFVADRDWVADELEKRNSELAVGIDVEITLRGSRIWSTKGKGLDGDFLADKLPTGNGTQGGDFVDWFRVRPRGADEQQPEAYPLY